MASFAQRVLPVLQLTRMALVFTAIADGLCAVLLRARIQHPDESIVPFIDPRLFVPMAIVSAGLYGFGMSLNDIIDRRRDRQLAAHRPLPSGRIGVVTAHTICALLAIAALVAGAYYVHAENRLVYVGKAAHGWLSLAMLICVGLLISFYDYAGKYLVAIGLLSLGMIRCFHVIIAAPELPLVWQPLLLLNHTTLLSTVAYFWEEKRPPLTKLHWWIVISSLIFIDVLALSVVAWWFYPRYGSLVGALRMTSGLWLAVIAAAVFVGLAALIWRTTPLRRDAGQKLMLYGLLWLIVYDAAFAAGYVGWLSGGLLLALLPVAWLSVQLMRWWSKLVVISQRPQFHRAGRDEPPAS